MTEAEELSLPRLGPVECPPGYVAEVVRADDSLALAFGKADGGVRAVDLCDLPSLFMGVLAQRDQSTAMMERSWADTRRRLEVFRDLLAHCETVAEARAQFAEVFFAEG